MPEGLAQRIEKSAAATVSPGTNSNEKTAPTTAKQRLKKVSKLIKFVNFAIGQKQDPAAVKAEVERLKNLATQLTAEEEKFLKVCI
jgi:hypothetical protein